MSKNGRRKAAVLFFERSIKIKALSSALNEGRDKYTVPRSVQDLIPIKCIYPDGMCRSGNRYSKTYSFSDINYMVASRSDKETMFLSYCDLLNSLDSNAESKITICNSRSVRRDFENSLIMAKKGDGLDELRSEFDSMILERAVSGDGKRQEKYVTITAAKRNDDEARAFFARAGSELKSKFSLLGSICEDVDGNGKIRMLHDFYRHGEEEICHGDIREMARLGLSFKDYIAPDSIEKRSDYMRIGKRYARALYIKDYASYIKDSLITELTEHDADMYLSIDILPVPTDEAIKEVESRLLGVETNITNWQRKQNQNNNFSALVPYDMELQRKEAKEFLDDLTTRDQRMMFALITVLLTSDSREGLESDTEALQSTARKHMCQMAVMRFQQLDALNTVLPIGGRRIDAFRTMTTESLAAFIPFKVQEIQEKNGICLGENAVSHNLILCNRENLTNQSTMILGVPGSGKSLCAKSLIWQIILNSDDDILICDPEGEYASMLSFLSKGMCSCVNMTAGGRDRLNAMYMVDGYDESNPTAVKSQFILSLLEQIDPGGVGPKHKSIVDRCVSMLYSGKAKKGKNPTLCDLRDALAAQSEEIAKETALSLELYTSGSLDIFGHESNVNLDSRIVCFDIHALTSQLKPAALLVITDTILNRVTLNWKNGKRTHVFIDEFHIVYENEYSAEFFGSAWRQFRKRNAYPTAITQNVEYLLDSVKASTMLSNSEFVIMLSQAARDREKLAALLNISDEQMSFVTNSRPGSGLIRYGAFLVPFENRFDTSTKLYSLMTTKPGEGLFGHDS